MWDYKNFLIRWLREGLQYAGTAAVGLIAIFKITTETTFTDLLLWLKLVAIALIFGFVGGLVSSLSKSIRIKRETAKNAKDEAQEANNTL